MGVGDLVWVPEGVVGSVVELVDGDRVVVRCPVEAPHPTRADRIVAGLEDREYPAGDLVAYAEVPS